MAFDEFQTLYEEGEMTRREGADQKALYAPPLPCHRLLLSKPCGNAHPVSIPTALTADLVPAELRSSIHQT